MKNRIINTAVVLIGLSFISCSNMTIGFEEDSPLYNGPLIDTREDKTIETEASQEIKKENQTIKTEISSKQEENETTFSYDPNDGD